MAVRGARCGAWVVLLVLLQSGLAPLGVGSASAQNADVRPASLKIVSWICPADYSGPDPVTGCTGLDVYRSFRIAGVYSGSVDARQTMEDGVATFWTLPEGRYLISGGVPAAYLRSTSISCAPANRPGEPFYFTQPEMRTINIAIGSSEQVVCTWLNLVYTSPPPLDWRFAPGSVASGIPTAPDAAASLTIFNRLCPSGYDDFDRIEVCSEAPYETAGLAFALSHAQTAATQDYLVAKFDGGTASFTNLPPGDVGLTSAPAIALDFIEYTVECRDAVDDSVIPVDDTGNWFGLTLQPGQDAACYFFTSPRPRYDNPDLPAPAPDAGSVMLYVADCPAGYGGDDFYADCYATPVVNVAVTLYESSGRDTTYQDFRYAATGLDGFTSFDTLDGVYTLRVVASGDHHVGCSVGGERIPVEDAPDGEGVLLTISDADDLRCDWYVIPAA